MKKKLSLLVGLTCLIMNQGIAQNTSSWFGVKIVGEKVWQISDHGADNIYLVEGKSKAMLIDNGLGTADLVSLVKKLTSKPLIVVITHGHFCRQCKGLHKRPRQCGIQS